MGDASDGTSISGTDLMRRYLIEHGATQADVWDCVVAPDMAQFMKGSAAPNRPLSQAQSKAMQADMNAGNWAFNGETLKCNDAGQLFDGQHRVDAIIRSGVPTRMLVALGCSEHSVDFTRTRGAGDVLAIAYMMMNGNDVAAAAKLILRYENTDPGDRLSSTSTPSARKTEVIARASQDLDIAAACAATRPHGAWNGWMPRSAMAMVAYFGAKTSPELVEQFIDGCRTGENLRKGDPRYALRSALISPTSRSRATAEHATALAVKGWRFYELGQKISLLKYLDSEGFPRFLCDAER